MVGRAPADVLPCSCLTLHLQNFGIDTELSAKPPVHAHDVAFIRLGQETFKYIFTNVEKQKQDEKDLLWLLMTWLSAEI